MIIKKMLMLQFKDLYDSRLSHVMCVMQCFISAFCISFSFSFSKVLTICPGKVENKKIVLNLS